MRVGLSQSVVFLLIAAVLVCLVLLGTGRSGAGESAGSMPNIVFFLVDDLGWADLGYQGSRFYETPHVDQLASQGMRFTDAYAACPVCSPTRASIMTGKYPPRLGITDWIPGRGSKGERFLGPPNVLQMPLQEVTVAEALKEKGYTTFFAGKWHLGGEGFLPDRQGFDTNIAGNHTGSPRGGYFSPYENPQISDGPDGEYLTDRLASEAVRFLDTVGQKPFFLFLSFYTVHTPIQPKQEYAAKFSKKLQKLPPHEGPDSRSEGDGLTRLVQNDPRYAAMVHSMDENIGRVLEKLEDLSLDQKTVVILMSDNGGLSTRSSVGPTSNLPLRAGKGWLYEGGIREPMIVRWPGVVRPGSASSEPVISTDFYPTLLEIAGMPLKPEQHLDGVSLVPLLNGGSSLDREAIYWHYPHHHGSRSKPGGAVRAGRFKLIEFFEEKRFELYDLESDLGEKHDLSAQMPGQVDRLRELLEGWRWKVGARMMTPNPDFQPE